MKENIDEMRKRHQAEIEDLQTGCEHKDVSGWMQYMWAPGHFGSNVKVCNFCGKIVENDAKPIIPIQEN
jgi:ABC-type ATPase with predicted acetyltransferase domain